MRCNESVVTMIVYILPLLLLGKTGYIYNKLKRSVARKGRFRKGRPIAPEEHLSGPESQIELLVYQKN